jgi:hypothetical protein
MTSPVVETGEASVSVGLSPSRSDSALILARLHAVGRPQFPAGVMSQRPGTTPARSCRREAVSRSQARRRDCPHIHVPMGQRRAASRWRRVAYPHTRIPRVPAEPAASGEPCRRAACLHTHVPRPLSGIPHTPSPWTLDPLGPGSWPRPLPLRRGARPSSRPAPYFAGILNCSSPIGASNSTEVMLTVACGCPPTVVRMLRGTWMPCCGW